MTFPPMTFQGQLFGLFMKATHRVSSPDKLKASFQSSAHLGELFAALLLLIGLFVCVTSVLMFRRQNKSPRLNVSDLRQHPEGTLVRTIAKIQTSAPILSPVTEEPRLYSRMNLLEPHNDKNRRFLDGGAYRTVAARPGEWAEECSIEDDTGSIPIRWMDVRYSMEQHLIYSKKIYQNPKIAAIFESFSKDFQMTEEFSFFKKSILLSETFIPFDGKFMIWGIYEKNPDAFGEMIFSVTEIGPPSERNILFKSITGMAVGALFVVFGVFLGYQTFVHRIQEPIPASAPVYGPPSGPIPLK